MMSLLDAALEELVTANRILAREGVVFESVLAPSSWTRTSVGSILTSLPPRSLGIFHEMTDALDDRFTTLAEVLWSSGYRTLGATANPNLNSSYRFDQGFDAYRDSDVLFPWMLLEPGKALDGPLPAGRELYRALLDELRQGRELTAEDLARLRSEAEASVEAIRGWPQALFGE